MNKYLSIITFNVNGLNASIKRNGVAEWIRKHDLHMPIRDHPQNRRLTQTENDGSEKNIPSNWRAEKKKPVAIHISDKIHCKTKDIKRDLKGHFIILKGRIHQEDINIYAPHIRPPKYKRKILEDFKKDIDSKPLMLGEFNTPLSIMDRSSKQNINKDIIAEQCCRSNRLNWYI